MDWIRELFTGEGTAQTVIFIAVAAFAGILIGKIKIRKISLGIAGVLFSGLLLGHMGVQIDHKVLHFIKEFGLILFVFSIGLEVGPRFFSALRKDGLSINLLATAIIVLGFGIAVLLKYIFNVPVPVMAGILCGAVTNTPSLGAAQQVLADQGGQLAQQVSVTGMGYAVAYPFGIIGIILTMLIVRWFFRIKTDREVKAYEQTQSESSEAPETINLIVKNPLMTGKTIGELKEIADERIQVSRLLRNNNIIFPADNLKLEMNDTLYVVVSKEYQEKLKVMVGETTDTNIKKIRGPLSMRHVVVTNRKISGKSLREINIYGRYNANITRIFRSGLEFIPSKGTKLEFGDTVRIVGDKHILKSVATELGDSERELQHPNILPIFIGIFLGVIVGSIPIAIPGLPAPVKLGLAGGPLLIAILLGRAGRIGKMDFYIPMGANLILRETGIVLFLACVGLGAGGQFVETIAQGGYIWMIYGAAITFIPIMSIAVVARFLRYNYLTICGLVSGSMTDPPALGFANAIADSQAQSTAYATVYPLVMFLRVLSAQVFVLLTL